MLVDMRILFLTFFISSIANATSCQISTEQFEMWNAKYGELIKVEVEHRANEYFVLATIPRELNGLKFNYVFLHQDVQSSQRFSAQLATFEEDGLLKTAYSSDLTRIEGNILTVGFGSDCGIDVSVPVVLDARHSGKNENRN